MPKINITLEEAHTKVRAHLISQGVRCQDLDGCRYRGNGEQEGMSCAVGVLIPDEFYRPEWDDGALAFTVEDLFQDLFPQDHDLYVFLGAAQVIHDSNMPDRFYSDEGSLEISIQKLDEAYNRIKKGLPWYSS